LGKGRFARRENIEKLISLSKEVMMKYTKLIGLIMIVGMAVSSLAFAESPAEPTGTFTFASAEPLTGNWDPTSHTILAQINIENQIFDKLYFAPSGVDNPGKLIPGLAVSWKQIDPRTMEYKLRKGVKFHDGTRFDAKDVKATLEFYSDPKKPGFGWIPGKLNVKIIDDYTAWVKTEKPLGSLLYSLGLVVILSDEDIAAGRVKGRPNGTGPWKFVRQEKDTTILEANMDYWAGPVRFKEFHWVYVPMTTARLFGLLAGEYDAIERVESEHVPIIEKDPDAAVQSAASVENKWLIFRCHKPPFDDWRVRRAISHAIDREGIVHILGRAGTAVEAHIPRAKFGYAPTPNNIEYNPKKALELLAEAGYKDIRDFPTLEYITSTGFYPKTKEYAEYIQATLGAIGINVNLKVFEVSPWLESLYNPEAADMIDTGWCSGTPEPDQIIRTIFHSSTQRMTFVSDPVIDKTLDKEQATTDLEERERILQKETLPVLMERVPALPLFTSVMIWGYRKELKNFRGWPANFFYLKDVEPPYGENDVYREK